MIRTELSIKITPCIFNICDFIFATYRSLRCSININRLLATKPSLSFSPRSENNLKKSSLRTRANWIASMYLSRAPLISWLQGLQRVSNGKKDFPITVLSEKSVENKLCHMVTFLKADILSRSKHMLGRRVLRS